MKWLNFMGLCLTIVLLASSTSAVMRPNSGQPGDTNPHNHLSPKRLSERLNEVNSFQVLFNKVMLHSIPNDSDHPYISLDPIPTTDRMFYHLVGQLPDEALQMAYDIYFDNKNVSYNYRLGTVGTIGLPWLNVHAFDSQNYEVFIPEAIANNETLFRITKMAAIYKLSHYLQFFEEFGSERLRFSILPLEAASNLLVWNLLIDILTNYPAQEWEEIWQLTHWSAPIEEDQIAQLRGIFDRPMAFNSSVYFANQLEQFPFSQLSDSELQSIARLPLEWVFHRPLMTSGFSEIIAARQRQLYQEIESDGWTVVQEKVARYWGSGDEVSMAALAQILQGFPGNCQNFLAPRLKKSH